ncbi:MAG: hypothetical protein JMN24_17575 [gamma proteobacterium endosymbiont of Lamellibrachia anaximandri]|nr:hypothetical protein [gamma proteobacterium endosymbiont of Lamellibrachia anaximandri]
MSRNSAESGSGPTEDIYLAMTRWSRLTDKIMGDALRISQPLIDSYFRNLTKSFSDLTPGLKKSHLSHCDIPETKCPPRCICQMSWEACMGNVVKGTIEVQNTGKQAASFSLSADAFHNDQSNSSIKPELNPASFHLAAGDSITVQVSIDVGNTFVPDDAYESEIRVAGRYEQCVRLGLFVRRRMTPHCRVEQGEIPTRIVAHQWYDHFQCEELCFEPVLQHRAKPERVGVLREEPAVRTVATNKRTTKKRVATKKQ